MFLSRYETENNFYLVCRSVLFQNLNMFWCICQKYQQVQDNKMEEQIPHCQNSSESIRKIAGADIYISNTYIYNR